MTPHPPTSPRHGDEDPEREVPVQKREALRGGRHRLLGEPGTVLGGALHATPSSCRTSSAFGMRPEMTTLPSIATPGVYSGGIPAVAAPLWRRLVARFKRLETLAVRVSQLERRAGAPHDHDHVARVGAVGQEPDRDLLRSLAGDHDDLRPLEVLVRDGLDVIVDELQLLLLGQAGRDREQAERRSGGLTAEESEEIARVVEGVLQELGANQQTPNPSLAKLLHRSISWD